MSNLIIMTDISIEKLSENRADETRNALLLKPQQQNNYTSSHISLLHYC